MNLEAILHFIDFSKAFDFIQELKMEQLLLADTLTKLTVTILMILYENTKEIVRPTVGVTVFFDIIAEAL